MRIVRSNSTRKSAREGSGRGFETHRLSGD